MSDGSWKPCTVDDVQKIEEVPQMQTIEESPNDSEVAQIQTVEQIIGVDGVDEDAGA